MVIEKLHLKNAKVSYILVDHGKEVARFANLLDVAIAKRFLDGCTMSEEELNIIKQIL